MELCLHDQSAVSIYGQERNKQNFRRQVFCIYQVVVSNSCKAVACVSWRSSLDMSAKGPTSVPYGKIPGGSKSFHCFYCQVSYLELNECIMCFHPGVTSLPRASSHRVRRPCSYQAVLSPPETYRSATRDDKIAETIVIGSKYTLNKNIKTILILI